MTTTRRLAAILAADVAGFSAAMERDEEGTYARVQELRRTIVEPTLGEYQGRLIKTTGDGFLVEFASPIAATRCALAIQAQMAKAPLKLRIGLNLGDVIVEESGDVYGEGVNIAARLEALADVGGILISAKVQSEIEGKIDAAFVDGGEQQLKNIARPIRVWRWIATDRPNPDHAPQTLAPFGQAKVLRDKPSLAVLPFQNMSRDPDKEYFSDGITEDIITNLSRFRELHVIARNSTFEYRGSNPDLAKIARELKTDYIVEGSVRMAGSRVRITSQLINVANSAHVWAERYDRELTDVFEVQDEITTRVATAVNPVIRAVEMQSALKKDSSSLAVWDHVLRGLWYFNQYKKSSNAKGRMEFEAAIARDPRCAQAHAWLAMTHVFDAWFNWTDAHGASLNKAQEAVTEALRSDDNEPMSYVASAIQCFWSGRLEQAANAGERAVALNPNSFLATYVFGASLNWLGQCEKAIGFHLRALDLSPADPFVWNCLGSLSNTYFNLSRYNDAIASADRAILLKHGYLFGRVMKTAALARAGRMREAKAAVDAIHEIDPDFSSARLDHYPFFLSAQREDLLDALKLAGISGTALTRVAAAQAATGALPIPDKPSL